MAFNKKNKSSKTTVIHIVLLDSPVSFNVVIPSGDVPYNPILEIPYLRNQGNRSTLCFRNTRGIHCNQDSHDERDNQDTRN